jgi:heme exporter protein D
MPILIWLLVGAAVLAVVWLIIFNLRRNRWFLRLQEASAIR